MGGYLIPMPRKLIYTVFHDDEEAPAFETTREADAIRFCRRNYHTSELTSLIITYHNPHARKHEGHILDLPADFKRRQRRRIE